MCVLKSEDPEVLASTRGLIGYIGDLVNSGSRAVRDCGKFDSVIWLDDLPAGVGRPAPDQDGPFLLLDYMHQKPHPSIPRVLSGWLDEGAAANPLGPAPELRGEERADALSPLHRQIGVRSAAVPGLAAAYRDWLAAWRAWAKSERDAEPARDLYRRLAEVARRTAQADDVYEVVLAVGLVQQADRQPLLRHVLTQRLDIQVSKDSGSVVAFLDPAALARMEDHDFLDWQDGYSTERSQSVRDSLDAQDLHPLGDDVWSSLKRWARLSFDEAVHCDEGWARPSSPPGSLALTLAPAIIMRTRGSNALAQLYQHIAASLEQPGARAPLGLVQLFMGLEPEERLAWTGSPTDSVWPAGKSAAAPLLPLPANDDQRLVLERIRSDTAVVVQGPPGTGKTHTIANLLCALLADGKRVLVTSQREQALRELRDKLPEQVRDLCVAHTGLRPDGTDDFGRSMTTLADRLISATAPTLERDIQALGRRREVLLLDETRIREQILRPREAEWALHTDVAPGYGGTLAQVAYQVAEASSRFAWAESLDFGLPPAAGAPPLSPAEGDELRALLIARAGSQPARRGQCIPDRGAIPSADAFEQVVSRAHHAGISAGSVPAASHALASLSKSTLRDIERLVMQAAVAASPLKLPERLAAWAGDRWEAVMLRDMFGKGSLSIGRDIAEAERQVADARREIATQASQNVTVPALRPGEAAELIRAATELRRVREEKRLRSRFMTGRDERYAERLLSVCHVDGQTPTQPDELRAVIAWLHAGEIAAEHARRWEAAGIALSAAAVPDLLRELSHRYRRLGCLDEMKGARDNARTLLARHGLRMTELEAPEGWDALRNALPAVEAVSIARQCKQEYTRFRERLPAPAVDEPPEMGDLRSAVRSGDTVGYRDALTRLDSTISELSAERRCEELIGRLRTWCPSLADELVSTATNPAWEERLRSLPKVTAWLSAKRFCERNRGHYDFDRELHSKLDEIGLRLARDTASLAAARACLHLISRVTEQDRLAIRQYRAAMNKLGKGTGVQAAAHRRAARKAMKDAVGAVPAWIMPVRKVAETVPAQPDFFDVVIIDEASQSKLDAVFLLWLAPRVIAVGDDQQCAPGSDQKHESHRDRLSARLPGLGEHQTLGLSPSNSLYDLLSVQFPAQIMLTEHFRSMPEIIGWSSKQFYEDRLVPLRQFDPDRLPPLQVCQVDDGLTDGRDEGIHNNPEAKHLVEKLKELLENPRYTAPTPKSFSIIALQGKAQAKRIRGMVRASFPPDVIDRHNIRIGDPPDFQGAESDIVMLSMVVTRPPKSLTGPQERRRFNVAATRARDQMWLFTSVERNRLKPEDLRTLLLDHMENSPYPLSHSPSADQVSDNELQDPFHSVFEQRVFRAIRERSYHVTPQHKVGEHRIDLVVTGSGHKLAIECDAHDPYGDPTQIDLDLGWERKLRNAGWPFWRIRESEYALSPEQAIAPLWLELARCGISPEKNDSQPSENDDSHGGSHE